MVRAGGPAVTLPTRRGFGTKFIETSIAFELNGSARIRFEETGVRCTMQLNLGGAEAATEDAEPDFGVMAPSFRLASSRVGIARHAGDGYAFSAA